MTREPAGVTRMHELMGRLQRSERIPEKEMRQYLREACEDARSHGIWIRNERDRRTGKLKISYIEIPGSHQMFACLLTNKR